MITEEQVLKALSHVEEPDLKKDLVTLNMIEDIIIEGNHLTFSVVLTTPACPLKTLIENACRNAIAHFISKDVVVEVKMTSRVTTQKNQPLSNIKNIVVVASGKGGVGKSTVSANLAIGLAQSGAKVGLIDADIYGPSIPIMFGLEGERPNATQTADGKTRIDPIEKFGIKLLSIGFFTDPNQPIPWRGPMASNAIKQLFNDADWGELDYLVVDLPPGTGDIHITLTQTYPVAGAVIVTTPQNVALSDAKKGIGMFLMEAINVPILGIVENMSYFTPAELPENKYYIFGEGGGRKLAEMYNTTFLGEIPLVKSISDAGDSGTPVILAENNPMAVAFSDLSERVAQQVSIVNAKGFVKQV
jgi:ATP-binding protein involved in chromosome partitioning